MLLGEYWRTLAFVARYPGGIYVHRDHKGDANGREPFAPVKPARQREALKFLQERILTDKPFNFLRHPNRCPWNVIAACGFAVLGMVQKPGFLGNSTDL